MKARYFLVALLVGLFSTHAAWAIPMDDPNGTPELLTTWGATTPSTILHWTFETSPSPAIQGHPDHLLTEFGFPKESTVLSREAKGAMVRLERDLRANGRDLQTVRLAIVGFTDNVTEASNAQQLGLRRSETARDYLVSLGFNRNNIQVASFGSAYSFAKPYQYIKQRFDRRSSIWILS
jgi:outer membrane protein OmpA-like peptidoglycan-associated protein